MVGRRIIQVEAKAKAAATYNAAADSYDDAANAFWERFGRRTMGPDLYKGFNPWDRICDPASRRALLRESGVDDAEVITESGAHPLPNPEAWWSAVLGSGYRGTFEQPSDADREYVRAANLDYMRNSGVRSIEANVVYAIACKR